MESGMTCCCVFEAVGRCTQIDDKERHLLEDRLAIAQLEKEIADLKKDEMRLRHEFMQLSFFLPCRRLMYHRT